MSHSSGYKFDRVVFKTPREQINALITEMEALRDEVNYHREDAKKWNLEFKASYRREVEATDQITNLRIALAKTMNRLASLLDEDQFANIEKIVEAAGVTPMDAIAKIGDDMWQPIETAPKIGRFLATMKTGAISVIVWLDADHHAVDEAGWYEHWNFDPVEPTHWMPLPTPPKVGADETGEG